jgi:acetyl-CoA decarbonylase/synthase complex subunit gamma
MVDERHYITGWLDTRVGRIPQVPTDLGRADKWGTFKIAWGLGRTSYTVDPGLYAIGTPDDDSLVLVTANYKLTFDTLRRELEGLDAWTMVLDTRGINVWCAAGEGTFGTDEVVRRIEQTHLEDLVSHRKLLLPQLGAAGVAAHEVKRRSGFSAVYGPIRATDIKPFLDAGMKATPEMRHVTFSMRERLRLVPVEVLQWSKYLLLAIAVFFGLSGLGRGGYSLELMQEVGLRSALNLLVAYLGGTVLGPVLLPWLPGRAFSSKGFFLGLAMFVLASLDKSTGSKPTEIVAWVLMMSAISSFIVMNFTGASNYTSLSGVRKEMRLAMPLQTIGGAVGIALWVVARYI